MGTRDSKPDEWPDVGRIVWCEGGLVAISQPGNGVDIVSGPGGDVLCSGKISAFSRLYSSVQGLRLRIIGTTFVKDQEEAEGLKKAEFRCAGLESGWALSDLTQEWRQVAFWAHRESNPKLADVAARIAAGLRYSEMRLNDLAEAYGFQLKSAAKGEKKEKRFKDIHSFIVYKSISALFWEMAVLRDVLSEFAASFIFGTDKATSLSGLLSFLKTYKGEDPLAKTFRRISVMDGSGWLGLFTGYRNFFTHVSPLEQSMGISFTILQIRKLQNEIEVPMLYYPLPKNADELSRRRAEYLKSGDLSIAREASRTFTRDEYPDCLDYLHTSLVQFSGLAAELIKRSPIERRPIALDASDLVGPINWNPGFTT